MSNRVREQISRELVAERPAHSTALELSGEYLKELFVPSAKHPSNGCAVNPKD